MNSLLTLFEGYGLRERPLQCRSVIVTTKIRATNSQVPLVLSINRINPCFMPRTRRYFARRLLNRYRLQFLRIVNINGLEELLGPCEKDERIPGDVSLCKNTN